MGRLLMGNVVISCFSTADRMDVIPNSPSAFMMTWTGKSNLAHWPQLQWRNNDRDDVSNNQFNGFLLNRLFRRRSKKTSKLRVTGLCVGNSPVTGEFPAQRASNAEYVPISWHLHAERCGNSTRVFFESHLCVNIFSTSFEIALGWAITWLMISQHWFVYWFGAFRQQPISWA